MDRRRCFEHVCPGEASVLTRLERVNYIHGGLRRWLYGENIAYGGGNYGTPRAIVRAWMHSPEHRHNILNPAFRQIGIGFARGIPPKPGAERQHVHDRLRDAALAQVRSAGPAHLPGRIHSPMPLHGHGVEERATGLEPASFSLEG